MYGFSKKNRSDKFLIEPEETFLDSLNNLQFDRERLEGQIERSLPHVSFFLIALVIFSIAILVGWRITSLQLFQHSEWFTKASAQSITVSTTPAPRGVIEDRNGMLLAGNASSFDLVFYKSEFLKQNGDLPEFLNHLSGYFGLSHDDIVALGFSEEIKTIPQQITILRNVDNATILFTRAHQSELPGVIAEERIRRLYKDGLAFSPTVGYVGLLSKEEQQIASESFPDALSGKLGIELKYNDLLQGSAGKKILQVDARGIVQKVKTTEAPKPGETITLTLDAGLQQKVYDVLASYIQASGKKAGAVVVMDPRDGSVRALVSYPSFNNVLFTKRLDKKDSDLIFLNPDKPLFNRAISGEYPPGSTIKPVMASAVLEENIIDPLKKIFDAGFISIPNPFQPGTVSIYKDWKALGWVDLLHAIAYSSNVYFYTVGGGFEDQQGLGVDRIKKYDSLFGLGQLLHIDFPNERPGLVPDPLWKSKNKPNDPIWRVGDTYNISIGQGDMLATPLQVASYTGVFANKGTLFQPHLLEKITDPDTKKVLQTYAPVVIRKDFVAPETIDMVRQGMRMVVTEGTARSLQAVPVAVAGKTGTAETGRLNEAHAWFTGFAPYDNPELVITVLIEKGGEGSTLAVPIAKEIFNWYFSNHISS